VATAEQVRIWPTTGTHRMSLGRPVWRVKLTAGSGMAAVCPTPVVRSRHLDASDRPQPPAETAATNDGSYYLRTFTRAGAGTDKAASLQRGRQARCRNFLQSAAPAWAATGSWRPEAVSAGDLLACTQACRYRNSAKSGHDPAIARRLARAWRTAEVTASAGRGVQRTGFLFDRRHP